MKKSLDIQQNLDRQDVIGSIRLELLSPINRTKIWIIVEGIDDCSFFKKLIDRNNVSIEMSYGGKAELMKVVNEFSGETNRVIGIRDADFLHLDKKTDSIDKNIFLTDFHDAEMMMIANDNTYKSLVYEYLIIDNVSDNLRNEILKSIVFIAGIRWINDIEDLSVKFKGLGFSEYFQMDYSISVKKETFLDTLMKRSKNKKREITVEEVDKKTEGIADLYNLCNGHDFQKVFALYINSKNNGKAIDEEQIASSFRLAYGLEDFKKSNLYSQLIEWSNIQKISIFE